MLDDLAGRADEGPVVIDAGRESLAAVVFLAAVKRHMKVHGVTQRMLARAMRVTEKHMSQVFRSKVRLTFEMAEVIAGHLGIAVEVRIGHLPEAE